MCHIVLLFLSDFRLGRWVLNAYVLPLFENGEWCDGITGVTLVLCGGFGVPVVGFV